MEKREYFIPPSNQINFQIDVPFEQLFTRAQELPSPFLSTSDFVAIRIENTLNKDSVRVIADKQRNETGLSLIPSQVSTIVKESQIGRAHV